MARRCDVAGNCRGQLHRACTQSSQAFRSKNEVPIGILFGLGFETSSQIAAYGAAFSGGGGAIAGIVVGLTFCAGLIVTDALDGFIVHYIIDHRSSALPRVARLWLWCVTIFAIAVAGYELAGLLGVRFDQRADLLFGLCMVCVLVATFTIVCVMIRVHRRICDRGSSLE